MAGCKMIRTEGLDAAFRFLLKLVRTLDTACSTAAAVGAQTRGAATCMIAPAVHYNSGGWGRGGGSKAALDRHATAVTVRYNSSGW